MGDVAQSHKRVDESVAGPTREIRLSRVAADDDARVDSHAREEHFHLSDRRILRLVENNIGVVERSSAHVRERRDFNARILDELAQKIRLRHIGERVEKRTQVRIDLFRKVAGQKPEVLARFDRRTNENDPSRFARAQRFDGARRREIRLARPRGTGAEQNLARSQFAAVFRLTGGFSANRPSAVNFKGRGVGDFLASDDLVERALNVVRRNDDLTVD